MFAACTNPKKHTNKARQANAIPAAGAGHDARGCACAHMHVFSVHHYACAIKQAHEKVVCVSDQIPS